MERVYNHELCRLLRLDGINAQTSEDGKATIPDIEGSKAVHSAFSKAHSRVVTQAVEIAEEIKAARHKGRLFPLHPTTLTAVSRQIANDRHRPPKESGIEKKITRAHWRHSIDRACLELIDQASQSRKGVRLRTVRNQNTQSVFLPSIVAEHTSSEFPHKAKRHITAVQVLIRCTADTPDLSARLILETALKYSAKICDRAKREEMESHIKAGLALTGVRILNTLESTDKIKATDPVLRRTLIARAALETALKHSAKICERPKREDMESHIKAGLALTGVRVLNTQEPTDKIKATDPHLRRTLIARVAPAMRRLRLASSIDKASEKYNQRSNGYSSTALSSALTQHFDTVRTAYVHH
jgi:predicted nucleic acid-binding protein